MAFRCQRILVARSQRIQSIRFKPVEKAIHQKLYPGIKGSDTREQSLSTRNRIVKKNGGEIQEISIKIFVECQKCPRNRSNAAIIPQEKEEYHAQFSFDSLKGNDADSSQKDNEGSI